MDQTTRGDFDLRYCLGDLRLFRVRFRACIVHQPFDPAAASRSLPSTPEIPKDVNLLVYAGRHIAEKLPIIRATRRAICYIRNQSENHYIDLAGTFEEYLKGFSSKTRSTLQRKLRKITDMADHTLECRAYRAPASVDEFHRLGRQVAVKTYQEKLFGGALPASEEFVRRARSLAQDDHLRGFILLIKGEPVAYLYLPVEDGALVYGYLGYDPDYASWSPGTVLLYLALEQLFAEQRFRYFNFTYGEGQVKELFGRATFLQADICFFRWTLRNALAVYGHTAMDGCSSKIGRTLEMLGLRQRIRKLLRRVPSSKAQAA